MPCLSITGDICAAYRPTEAKYVPVIWHPCYSNITVGSDNVNWLKTCFIIMQDMQIYSILYFFRRHSTYLAGEGTRQWGGESKRPMDHFEICFWMNETGQSPQPSRFENSRQLPKSLISVCNLAKNISHRKIKETFH